jgi:uncharacterized protein (TIRG00374 family)
MKKSTKNWITGVFLFAGLIGLYYILRKHSLKDIFALYANFDLITLLLYVLSLIVLMMVLTWRWDVVLRSRNIKIPYNKLFIYRIIGMSINFLTPGPRVGGEPTQATLLTKHGVQFKEGLTTIMNDKMIDVTTSGVLFIIGIFMVGMKYSIPEELGWIIFTAGAFFVVLIFSFYYQMLNNKHFFLKIFHLFRLNNTKSVWLKKLLKDIEHIELMMMELYNQNRKYFLGALAISILSWVVMFVEYKLATQLLGLNVGIAEIFFIVSFVGLALLFPIPMAIGVLEAGQLSAFALINLSASLGIALAFLIRFKDIIWSIVGVILLFIYGFQFGKIKEIVGKKYGGKNGEDSLRN